jgi:PHD/YefM family antitoxin component YafN of YafNO toxin-antitoxin module
LSVEDLEALEETLDLLSDAESLADLHEVAQARQSGGTIRLPKDEALAHWSRG